MKIAIIHMRHANLGGTELFLNHLSRYLAEKGEDVTIICRSHVEPSHPAIKFVQLRPFSVGKAHRIWRFAKAVEKHVNDSDYDFVYGLGKTWTHDMLRVGGGTALHHFQYVKKSKSNLKHKIAVKIEKKAMMAGAYQHIVTNSYKSAEEVVEAYHVPSSKISIIHNFVDTRRFDRKRVTKEVQLVRSELEIDQQAAVFLFLGTGYKRKGLTETLEAFAKLDINACLLIVGRESHVDSYKKMAERLGVLENCRFLGESDKPEVYFSIADCYVLPALYEPFGFTVIEALACGTPVITSQNCGAKEVLDESVSSVVDQNVNIDQLSACMTKWAKYKGDNTLQKKCRDLALTLDVDVIMEKNYQEIIAAHHVKESYSD